ncbi:LysR family transcriptional regulator [Nannocystis pusilla]|uniref:LysR family transcriptional regulator n=1 Tax=Nannocystis pusilla TaxID=889268 RepID=UPI003BF0ACCE
MQLQGVDLNLLVALEALLSERSVTRAGARLGLTASATSHALGRLRATFGDELLVRTRGGMIPTARGEQLLVPLRAALRDVGALLSNSARFDPRTSRREFVLASTDYIEAVLLPPLLARVSAAAPGVQLRVRPLELSDVAAPLETGAITVALGVVFENSPGLQQQALFSEEMVLVCRKGHPDVKRTIDLATYLRLRHVLVSVRGGSQSVVDEQLAELGHARQIALVVPHFLAAPLIVASSDLVLTTPARLVRRLGPALDLRTLAPPLAVPGFTVRQVWHERHQDDPGHLWLRQQIFAAAKTLATGKDGSRC